MTWEAERFKGRIGMTDKDSQPAWNLPPRLPEGTPNIIYIVLDDVGFATSWLLRLRYRNAEY